jgi:hypothetical protein
VPPWVGHFAPADFDSSDSESWSTSWSGLGDSGNRVASRSAYRGSLDSSDGSAKLSA